MVSEILRGSRSLDQYLGVDPGASSGGLAIVDGDGRFIVSLKLANATPHDIASFVRAHRPDIRFAVLERVSAMPKQGVASSFKFGASYGELRMALAAEGVPYEEVSPAKWQTAMKCRSGGDKNVTKAAAQRLWPNVKVTHATADGMLLAEYARRLSAERSSPTPVEAAHA